MFNKKIDLFDAYKVGSNIVINNIWFFCVAFLAASFLLLFSSIIICAIDYMVFNVQFLSIIFLNRYSMENIFTFLTIILPVIVFIKLFCSLIAIGFSKLALDLQDNKPIKYSYLIKFYYLVPRIFIVEIIKYIGIVFCFFLFVIPMGFFHDYFQYKALLNDIFIFNIIKFISIPIFWLLFVFSLIFLHQRFRFTKYFVIDSNKSVINSFKSSWNVTKGSVFNLCVYSIFSCCVMLFKIIFPFILFISPLENQVDVNIYRQMLK